MDLRQKRIAVFCSSSASVAEVYVRSAEILGAGLAREGAEIVFGGTDAGMMSVLAKAALSGGGRVTGVIPEKMLRKGLLMQGCSEVFVSPDLHGRKARMHEISHGVVCLPGGIGTLDELAESLALRQLRYQMKPVVLVNAAGYFDPLLAFFDKMRDEGFGQEETRGYFSVVSGSEEAVEYLKSC